MLAYGARGVRFYDWAPYKGFETHESAATEGNFH